jgi:glutamyl-Q tRNA(Asp) synthetase
MRVEAAQPAGTAAAGQGAGLAGAGRGSGYVGRFAPSPTGPLHAGSLVAALASWLDARAHGGRWLVRIEDVDTPRCVVGATGLILGQLAAAGLLPDAPPLVQSTRGNAYTAALTPLIEAGLAYRCSCSRQDIARALAAQGAAWQRHAAPVYPGTCRHGPARQPANAWRLRTDRCALRRAADAPTATNGAPASSPFTAPATAATAAEQDCVIGWHDRRLGDQQQNLTREVGDFVLRRADGLWSYQLAVVVDDAAQGVTHVVRGEDLADNTARQIHLQRMCGLGSLCYLHVPLVRAADGQKLSKQTGAQAVDLARPLDALQSAARTLGLPPALATLSCPTVGDWLAQAVQAWRAAWVPQTPADRPGAARPKPTPAPATATATTTSNLPPDQ